ncbi:MAG: SH3 domain-containing protein [Saprospiraceae bacterium]
MKKAILLIISLLLNSQAKSQIEENCFGIEYIVAAENLNFRSQPNPESKIIGKLANAEKLTLIEIDNQNGEDRYCCYPWVEWLKVKREKNGEIGYVSGQFVKPQNIAYLNGQSCDRIQNGYWYGIYNEEGKAKIERVNPKVKTEVDGSKNLSVESKKYRLIVGSQKEFKEGMIQGQLFKYPNEYIKIGTNRKLLRIGGNEFRLICTGEVKLEPPYELQRVHEKLELLTIKSYTDFKSQELTNCLFGFGNIGYQIHFIGDLNKDGFPELILSESGETEGGMLYYFMSNKDGKLELKSLVNEENGC